jgi:threonine dehydratase
VDLPDKPGELLRISELLANMDANVIKLNHNQFTSLDRLMDVQLGITVETNGHDHRGDIIHELQKKGFKIRVD